MPGQNASPPARLLLVEGHDDRHFVQHIWKKYRNNDPSFDIKDKDGISNLIDAIRAEVKVSGRKVLGIVRDANGDLKQSWQQVTDPLKEVAEYLQINPDQIPNLPESKGWIIDCQLRIGIWLMPDNQSSGEMENFAVKMLPKDDPVWPYSEEYVEKIPMKMRKFDQNKVIKAKLFAWLATRKKPGRVGAAIGASDLTSDNDLSQNFLEWLSRLFQEV